jgi:octaprenyl-diphosphate synthase
MTADPKSPRLRQIYRGIEADLEAVEAEIRRFSRNTNPLIAEVDAYLLEGGGKRVRPALLILASRLFDYGGRDHVFWSAIIETIHTASLVHDDIVDNAALRRGRDTVHARWGGNITVLLGDFLYIRAITLALKTRANAIIDVIADATAQMIEGEIIESSISGRTDVTEAQYMDVLDKKTASLFSAACRIGGLIAGAGAEAVDRLGEFGTNLGLAFQIVDDLLDYTSDAATLGKPVLSDFREGRLTLPVLHALGRADAAGRAEIESLVRDRKTDSTVPARVLKIVSPADLDDSAARARDFVRRAKDGLLSLPRSNARDSLIDLTDLVLQRRS